MTADTAQVLAGTVCLLLALAFLAVHTPGGRG